MNRPAWRIMSEETREALADYAHAAWSGWMKYQFSKAEIQPDGTWIMPAWAVERWQRQMNTPYTELPEEEKASDRKEADEMLAIVGTGIAQAVAAERARVVGELREKLIRSRELLEMGHEFASEYVTAFSTAIAIAEGES